MSEKIDGWINGEKQEIEDLTRAKKVIVSKIKVNIYICECGCKFFNIRDFNRHYYLACKR